VEGKSVSTIVAAVLCLTSVSVAQTARVGSFDPASFLEPNRFSITKDLDNRSLWLAAGYGHVIVGPGERERGLGLEGVIWSRLRFLSGFRFPVETADYFFGLYATLGQPHGARPPEWRVRVSHISSHLVDGADSAIVGGSSSRFSREFVEVTRRFDISEDLTVSGGVRWLFHQVQRIEPEVAFPATLSWRFYNSWDEPVYDRALGRDDRIELSLYATSAYGPSWPNYGAGFVATISNDDKLPVDLKTYYLWGAPWAGIEAAKREGAVRAEVSIRAF
jgi:hypothetical protein